MSEGDVHGTNAEGEFDSAEEGELGTNAERYNQMAGRNNEAGSTLTNQPCKSTSVR